MDVVSSLPILRKTNSAAWSISQDEIARWAETTGVIGKTWDALCPFIKKKEELYHISEISKE